MILDVLTMLFEEATETDGGGSAGPTEGDATPAPEADPAPTEDVEVVPLPEEPEETPSVDQPQETPPAYKPNLKYKVLDAEKDLPEWIQGLLTDADSEARVRDLFERADGMEHLKASREAVGRELDTVRGQYAQQSQAVQALSGLARRGMGGDIHAFQSFFEALQIPEEAILRYAGQRFNTLNNPELQARYDAERRAYIEQNGLAQERDFYRNAATQAAVTHRTQELDIAMARPEVSAAAKAFDTRMGRVGAFRAQVIQMGQAHAAMNRGADLGVNDAIKQVIDLAGLSGGAGSAPAAGAAGSPQNPGTAGAPPAGAPRQAPQKKPVIPNIAGSGASPVAVVPKSIKQLREMQKQLAAEGR